MKNILNLKPKAFNITKWLEKNKGGKWKYDKCATWWCDDGIRHLSRVCMDFTDEHSQIGYYLYGGDSPGYIYFY